MGGAWKVTAERFISKAVRDPETDCWQWMGYINDQGYGICYIGKDKRVHRVIYELVKGPIPATFMRKSRSS